MILESILTKHAKKFAGGKDAGTAIQGITYTGNHAYVTNAHMLLRVGGQEETDTPVVRSLAGKQRDVTPVNFERLVPDAPVAATVNVKEMLDAVRLMRDVLKTVKGTLIEMSAVDGELILGIYEEGLVSGSTKVSGKFNSPFYRKVNVEYLYICLMVFSKDFETIEILADENRVYPIVLTAGEVLTLLLPVR